MGKNYKKLLRPVRFYGLSCDLCKESLESTDLAIECPDCAAIFCSDCAKDGFFSTHQCEEYKDEEYDPITWRDDDVALFEEGFWCD